MSGNEMNEISKQIEENAKAVRFRLGVVDHDAPYLLHYDVELKLSASLDYNREAVFDFLNRIDMLHTVEILEQIF